MLKTTGWHLGVMLLASCLLIPSPGKTAPRCEGVFVQPADAPMTHDEQVNELVSRFNELSRRSVRPLTQYEVLSLLMETVSPVMEATQNLMAHFQGDPQTTALLADIKKLDEGNGTTLQKVDAMHRLLSPSGWNKYLRTQSSREWKIQKLADEIKACRTSATTCEMRVHQDIQIILGHLDRIVAIEKRIDEQISVLRTALLTIESNGHASESQRAAVQAVNSEISRLAALRVVLESHMKSVKMESDRATAGIQTLQLLHASIIALVEKGAPPVTGQVDEAAVTSASNVLRHQREEAVRQQAALAQKADRLRDLLAEETVRLHEEAIAAARDVFEAPERERIALEKSLAEKKQKEIEDAEKATAELARLEAEKIEQLRIEAEKAENARLVAEKATRLNELRLELFGPRFAFLLESKDPVAWGKFVTEFVTENPDSVTDRHVEFIYNNYVRRTGTFAPEAYRPYLDGVGGPNKLPMALMGSVRARHLSETEWRAVLDKAIDIHGKLTHAFQSAAVSQILVNAIRSQFARTLEIPITPVVASP